MSSADTLRVRTIQRRKQGGRDGQRTSRSPVTKADERSSLKGLRAHVKRGHSKQLAHTNTPPRGLQMTSGPVCTCVTLQPVTSGLERNPASLKERIPPSRPSSPQITTPSLIDEMARLLTRP